MEYRNPGQLEQGGVLVVGAAATGIQIAAELHGSGRPVTIAVGEHIRVPRVYRGKDVKWWMDAAGVLDDPYEEADNLDRARNVPLSANVRETRSTQRIRVGRRQRKRTCWDCEREWKRMVVPLEPGRPSEARQFLRTQR